MLARTLGMVGLTCMALGCASPAVLPPGDAAPRPCNGATHFEFAERVQVPQEFIDRVSRGLVQEAFATGDTDSVWISTSATSGPANDSLRSALLSVAMYPPVRSTSISWRAARRFLRAGGRPTDLVIAAENARTLDLTRELLRAIPDSAVPDRARFAGLRCAADAFLRAYDQHREWATAYSLGEIAFAYQFILEDIYRIQGRKE